MSKIDKLIIRFLKKPKDFTWDELTVVLGYYGFTEIGTGKTGGSRRKFVDANQVIISLHKPHPNPIVKHYVLEQVMETLKENGKLK